MPTRSAVDSISPAFARTKLVLFTPFRFGRTWKLAVTGYVSTMGTFCFPIPLLALYFLPLIHRLSPRWVPWVVGPGVIALTALLVFIFFLCSRLPFVFFDLVLNRSQFVRPEWRKYRDRAKSWTLFKFVVGVAITLVPGSLLAWYILRQIAAEQDGRPASGSFPAWLFFFLISFYLVILLAALTASVLNDFIVPTLAFEDTTLAEAAGRAKQLVLREPSQVALYTLFKVLLGFAAQMAITMVFELGFFLAAAIIGGVSALLGSLLHSAGVPNSILGVVGIAILIPLYLFFVVYMMPLAAGISFTFLEAYKLYFLSGRYPFLGELLDRSTPPPPTQNAWPSP